MATKKHGMQMGTGGYGISHGVGGKLGSSSYHAGDTGGSHGDHAFHETKAFEVKAPHIRATRKSGRKKKSTTLAASTTATPASTTVISAATEVNKK
jgi:hypothetical protein